MYVHNTEGSGAILPGFILTQYHCLVECIFGQRFQVYNTHLSWRSCHFGNICTADYNMQVNCESSTTLRVSLVPSSLPAYTPTPTQPPLPPPPPPPPRSTAKTWSQLWFDCSKELNFKLNNMHLWYFSCTQYLNTSYRIQWSICLLQRLLCYVKATLS